jgi:hypothetical protein
MVPSKERVAPSGAKYHVTMHVTLPDANARGIAADITSAATATRQTVGPFIGNLC